MKQFKTSLEKASKLSRAFKKEMTASEDLAAEVHAELTSRESSKISKDVESELNYLQVGCFSTCRIL